MLRYWDNHLVADNPARYPLKVKYHTGVVPQDDNLDEEVSVFSTIPEQNFGITISLYGKDLFYFFCNFFSKKIVFSGI